MSVIAREAGALLMEYFHQHLKIEYKGEADLVTAARPCLRALIRENVSGGGGLRMTSSGKSRGSTTRAATIAGTSIRSMGR